MMMGGHRFAGAPLRGALAAVFSRLAASVLLAGCGCHGGKADGSEARPRFEVTRTCRQTDPDAPGALRALITDASGTPLAGVTVRIADAGGTAAAAAARVETDERGEAEVGVRAGLWQIDASRPGFEPGQYLLELKAGQACDVRFKLRETGPDQFVF